MNIYGKLAGKAELTKQNATQNDIPPTENQEIDHHNENPQETKIPEEPIEPKIPIPTSDSKSTTEESHHGTEEKKPYSSSIPPMSTLPNPPILKKPQPCWKNCVIITPCPLPQMEPFLPPDITNTDVHQEILLSYVAYKVFENEDESYESFYWRKLLRKPSNNDMGNANKRMKFSIWEKIEEKEKEVHSRVMNDSQYLENLLLSIKKQQDPVPEESESNNSKEEVLQFFPGINMRFQDPFRPQPQENYQGYYNLFPKKQNMGMRNYPFQKQQQISSSSHYENNEPLNPYYVFNNRHF